MSETNIDELLNEDLKAKLNKAGYKITEDTYKFSMNEQVGNLSAIIGQRITSLQELIKYFEVDTTKWKVKRWDCTSYDSHVKLKTGDNKDLHQIIPLYKVSAQFEVNTPLIDIESFKREAIQEIKKHKPKYRKPTYQKNTEPYLYEINPCDVHFGKHAWGKETGEDWDIEIASDALNKSIDEHINISRNYNVEKYLFIVGNDYFNVDGKENQTGAGTQQQEDTRWKKTFWKGTRLIISVIDRLRNLAPVDVLVIPGNHDVERAYYLGVALECFYDSVDAVNVNNSPANRKYYQWGKCLVGFTHGKDEKLKQLPTIMAIESPELFGKAKYREWHLGHLHQQKQIETVKIDEEQGVTMRILRSISPADQWHYSKGYIGSLRTVEGFLWHKENGLVAHFNANL